MGNLLLGESETGLMIVQWAPNCLQYKWANRQVCINIKM
jgi:hypothetical protein